MGFFHNLFSVSHLLFVLFMGMGVSKGDFIGIISLASWIACLGQQGCSLFANVR
jgi:hypothetical protein